MCGHDVIASVRAQVLSRRHLLLGGAAAGAAVTAASLAPPRAAAQTAGGTIRDLTHTLSPDFPTFFGEPQFAIEQLFHFDKDGFNLFKYTVNEHTGTHVDAPLHFSADGQSVDEIPVDNLMAPLAVVDIAAKAAEDPDAQVTPDDLKAWIAANGDIPERACVALYSGWERFVSSDKFRNVGDDGKMHFPGFHVEAAQMLIEETSAVGIAVDTLSLDYGPSPDFATHYKWLPTNRWGVECVAGLGELPPTGATIILGAPKHAGGSGGPARVFALV
ncbi:cyclase family protein [Acuticoccus mangrovi]|uniref:Cyclase family protein n=1 Tax=Acuticoccus mangrovi TaxID=2796142 RepID=A0A934IPL1_9HYPH|nr:cyclase family protein [Acuticoccus mangrovi]MBJ3776331.1 cyclase family protein [Acuticoccus mangrovi]